jgi:hypothetical protein
MSNDLFRADKYLIRRQIFKLLGAAFNIYDSFGNLAFYAKMKAFKLKEDIRLYTDEKMETEALTIKCRQILDFSGIYDVIDAASGEKVGALRRKGMKSIVRDEWIILDAADNEIGLIQEDSALMAALRRISSMVFANLIPQSFHCQVNGNTVCSFKQHFNPFVFKMDVDFSSDLNRTFDRRLGLAAAVLLCAIEGRQD